MDDDVFAQKGRRGMFGGKSLSCLFDCFEATECHYLYLHTCRESNSGRSIRTHRPWRVTRP